jgi:uncharacterized membrane protein (TIGR01666 family)
MQKIIDVTHFTNAAKVTIAAVLPVLFFHYMGDFKLGFTIALGAFFTYPSDIPSNLKHKINGLFVATCIVSGVNLFINLVYPYPFIFYPAFALLLFTLCMLSVYGSRANMIGFSALLSISLTFAQLSTGIEMIHHAGFLFLGGILYMVVSVVFFFIRPNRYVELQIAECLFLTSKYLRLRGDLWELDSDRKEITKKQLHLQVELNVIHENLRDILIANRTRSGSTNRNRKMLLVFITLMEIIELTISTSFDHNKLHAKFDAFPEVLKTYQKLAYNLAKNLKKISKSIEMSQPYKPNHNLDMDLQEFENAIAKYENDLGKEAAQEGVMMLTTMLNYIEKQIEKTKILENAFDLKNTNLETAGIEKDIEKFVTPQYYPIRTLLDNLSFSSSVFRHSLRVTFTLIIGFIIGKFLPFQNVYWILLTIVVIMRQEYSVTKERTFHRIYGTLIGGVIAFGLLTLIHNVTIISSICILAMVLGFLFAQSDYKIGVVFITIHVIFVYGIITPNFKDVIEYRILDTIVGAILAFSANYFLWPFWESMSVKLYIENAIQANQAYLREIALFYNKKGTVSLEYRLARKQAFIEVGNLMASLQRMIEEPKAKQANMTIVYKLTVLNHAILSSAASMGTYIQSKNTTSASNTFNVISNQVVQNMEWAIQQLKIGNTLEVEDKSSEIERSFNELKRNAYVEDQEASQVNSKESKEKRQEAQQIIEQLIWLNSLSNNILKTTKDFLES